MGGVSLNSCPTCVLELGNSLNLDFISHLLFKNIKIMEFRVILKLKAKDWEVSDSVLRDGRLIKGNV